MSEQPAPLSGARAAAEEIIPMPLVPRILGGRAAVRQVEARRRNAERIIETHCVERSVALRAWRALDGEARRLAMAGRTVPSDILDAMAALQQALGME